MSVSSTVELAAVLVAIINGAVVALAAGILIILAANAVVVVLVLIFAVIVGVVIGSVIVLAMGVVALAVVATARIVVRLVVAIGAVCEGDVLPLVLAVVEVVGTVVDVNALVAGELLMLTVDAAVEAVIMTLIVVIDFVCVLAMSFHLSPKVLTVAVDVVPIGVL